MDAVDEDAFGEGVRDVAEDAEDLWLVVSLVLLGFGGEGGRRHTFIDTMIAVVVILPVVEEEECVVVVESRET